MNIKKIGMTALAASLVSVSANAAELSVSGGASINMNQYSAGADLNYGHSFTMGNALVFSGSGELENGLNVSVSFELDEGANSGNRAVPKTAAGTAETTTAPASTDVFDNHSFTVSSDHLGTLIFSGPGGTSATTTIITTAAGHVEGFFDIPDPTVTGNPQFSPGEVEFRLTSIPPDVRTTDPETSGNA